MSTKEELLARNRHLNALLENTRATLEEERKINAATKTRIPGGFYLMNKLAEKNLRDLQIANPTASLVLALSGSICKLALMLLLFPMLLYAKS